MNCLYWKLWKGALGIYRRLTEFFKEFAISFHNAIFSPPQSFQQQIEENGTDLFIKIFWFLGGGWGSSMRLRSLLCTKRELNVKVDDVSYFRVNYFLYIDYNGIVDQSSHDYPIYVVRLTVIYIFWSLNDKRVGSIDKSYKAYDMNMWILKLSRISSKSLHDLWTELTRISNWWKVFIFSQHLYNLSRIF